MLPEFRKRIDSLRDTLVGAVPSPAGQIEQITYALIYKFMSDIDDRAASLPGGKRTYFTGEYEKYGWHELMAPTLGSHERLTLYRDALGSLAKNPGLPILFQEIYQNAYLTFNDPRVLTLFLKEIDNFKHSSSDDIGDAYEYLLQITGAQGDVGQFRTPRHIIKFIVDVVNPTKNDSVLDPAVGTAGFLIAAYNHVKHHHDGIDEISGLSNDREKRLNADEKEKMNKNYHGFDIDPTMVRTAKVNMYLHGFTTPDIKNYDSLTETTYWNDYYDVILANPPFMSPKGGIKPHDKFGIVANRAEVLFVDYIASHLKPNGRAGIVVPEGIIFQSGKAYKELRKNLVDNYLYAVVSLPAGVFQPYSGVKTSVLLLDKELAGRQDEILFVKIENDGYSLGAQRRETTGSQLPSALELIEQFKKGEEITSNFAHSIQKERIAKSGDYNLSGDRYRVAAHSQNQEYPLVAIESAVDTISAKVKIKSSEILDKGLIPVVDQGQKLIAGYTNNTAAAISDIPVVTFGDHTRLIKYVNFEFAQGADGIKILKPKDSSLIVEYLYYIMSNIEMPDKGYSRHWSDVKKIKIPLPPPEIQRTIVTELDGYQKIIDAAKTIVKTYKPNIKINQEWETISIKDLANTFKDGDWIESKDQSTEGIRLVQTGNVGKGEYLDKKQNARYISEETFNRLACTEIKPGQILVSRLPDPVGRSCIVPSDLGKSITAVDCTIIDFDSNKMLNEFFLFLTQSEEYYSRLNSYLTGSSRSRISRSNLGNVKIPVPPIKEQEEIVTEIKAEQSLINASRQLITIYQQKIRNKIAEVREE